MKLRGVNSNCGIQEFYDNVALAMGIAHDELDKCRYAVSKIEVSQDVADNIMDYYRDRGESDVTIAMLWLNYGPKTDEHLSEDMVNIEEGFLTTS